MSKNNQIKVLRIMGKVGSGGVENITMNYFRQIDKSKIQLDFIFDGYNRTNFEKEIIDNGSTIYKVEPYSKNIFKNLLQIYQIIKKNNYQIVHSHLNALSVLPLLAAKLAGADIRIASNHSTAEKGELKKSIAKYILRPFSRLFPTHYAACSVHAAEWLFGEQIASSKQINYIKNAINLDKFKYSNEIREKVRKNLDINDQFVIGHAGRFAYQKNHRFIIDVFEKVHFYHSNTVLLLAGEGELLEDIKKYVREKNLQDYVIFLGVRKDMHEVMQAIDVFLFPSLYEGLGNVVTETQAVSTMSVVSSAIPDEVIFTEYVKKLSLRQSIDEWTNQVLEFKDGYVRRNTQKQLEQNGYDIKLETIKLEEYYESLYEYCN